MLLHIRPCLPDIWDKFLNNLIVFSCPQTARQLYIGDLVTPYLPTYYTLLKNTTKEHSERLVTLETCYQSDEET